MKKSKLTLALATALFTSITLLNCSKKNEPAPAPAAASTTSGTTTSGTSTSGTTTSGSTTSGTTTSGTTTSGSTTSSTTSGSTTSSTTSGSTTSGTTTSGTKKVTGTGTITVDGSIQTLKGEITISEDSEKNLTTITFGNDSYRLLIAIGKSTLQDGIYSVDDYINIAFGIKDAGLAVIPLKPYTGAQFWSIKDATIKVTVSGKKISVGTVNLQQYTDATKKMNASCDITLN